MSIRVIDAHQHFWNHTLEEFAWIDDVRIRRDFLPEDLCRETEAAGVDAVVSVQARTSLEETRWLLEHAGRHSWIAGVVGWVPLTAPDLGETLAELTGAHSKLRGVREVMQGRPAGALLDRDFNAGVSLMDGYGLTYDLLVYEDQLGEATVFADRHPGLTLVLDHLGKPRIRDGRREQWEKDLRELALRPGHIEVREIPEPGLRGDEVLLRIRRGGFCGSDLGTFRGLNPLVAYPRIPGHELAGTIVETGSDVPGAWAGGMDVLVVPYTSCGKCPACRQNRANCCRHNQTLGVQRDGGLCDLLVVPWTKLMTAPGLSFAELAMVEPLTVGFHAVARGRVASSDTVLVLGCGAIGLGAIAGAAERGARVVAVDLDDAKLVLAAKAGAAVLLKHSGPALHERLLELTGGEGAEVVIEAVGLPATFRAAVEEVCFAGRVVYIGYAKAPVEYETRLFVQKELDILGSRNAEAADFDAVIRMLQTGRFPVAQAITRTVLIDEAPQAMRDWDANPLAFTKIQIAFGE